ncbi:diguanylate cyclase domain-containing protein [Kineococcus sp. TBRC 1896]|uniref:Diguanylate cyclase domain-containing protein n=1 Tax=Kineococcus mangrovi TaxID=1660183 RepID=A0ABV4HXF7_9ACTN
MDRNDWIALAQADRVDDAVLVAPAAVPSVPAPSPREAARLAVLHGYRLLDAPADDELSAVVRAAAVVADVPHATLNLIAEDRQCQLTTVGFEGTDSARADSMCALHFEEGLLVHVPDASQDPRFARNPWVDGRLGRVRSYASAPLVSPEGHALGSLCVFDTVPGHVVPERLSVLQDLAGVLVALFERRRQAREAAEQGRRAGEARELAVLAMAEAEARWEQSEAVAETVDVGLVVVDAAGHVTSLNRTARQWHGESPAHLAADGRAPLAPGDLPWSRALRDGSVEDVELVLTTPGQAPRTLVCSGRSMRSGDGTPLGAVVALHDVTEARQREKALARAHATLAEHTARVQALADASRTLAAARDPQQAVCHLVRELTGADAAYLLRPAPADDGAELRAVATVGFPSLEITYPLDEPSLAGLTFTSAEPVFVGDVATHPRASQRWVDLTGVVSGAWHPVVLSGQRTVGVLGVFWRQTRQELGEHVLPVLQTLTGEVAHAAERTELLQRLAEAAERDTLTGLANRRRWDEVIATEVARAARTGEPLSVAVIDLDHFKRYNDTHGHLGGDVLLREFADAALACLREVDVIARWGGEEFVVALPGCAAEDAVTVADRIRAVVPRGQSCTIGVARWRPGLLAQDVVRLADAALYAGKEQGRDRTVVHP